MNAVTETSIWQGCGDLRIIGFPGTGKTTTLMRGLLAMWESLGEDRQGCYVLFLCYNREHRLEINTAFRKEFAALGDKRGTVRLMEDFMEVTSYDHYLYKYYDEDAPSDFQIALSDVLNMPKPPRVHDAPKVTHLVIDEAQDMTPEYATFVQKILKDRKADLETLRVILAGDPKQTIYGYKGADPSFLLGTSGNKAELPYLREMVEEYTLTSSFRCGPALCALITAVCRPLFAPVVWPPGLAMTSGRATECSDGSPVTLYEVDYELGHVGALVRDISSQMDSGNHVAFLSTSVKDNRLLYTIIDYCNAADTGLRFMGGRDFQELRDAFKENARVMDPAAEFVEVRTAYTAKGKENDVTCLILPPWGGKTSFRENVLFVGMSRPRKKLIIVQECESRAWDEILAAGSNTGLRLPVLSASTGFLTRKGPLPGSTSTSSFAWKRDLLREIGRLHVSEKKTLMGFVDGCKEGTVTMPTETSVPELSNLCRLAVITKLYYYYTGRVSFLGSLVEWLQGGRDVEDLRKIHKDISRESACPSWEPSLAADIVRRICTVPVGSPETWEDAGWTPWRELAGLTQTYQFGHIKPSPIVAADTNLDCAFDRVFRSLPSAAWSMLDVSSGPPGDAFDTLCQDMQYTVFLRKDGARICTVCWGSDGDVEGAGNPGAPCENKEAQLLAVSLGALHEGVSTVEVFDIRRGSKTYLRMGEEERAAFRRSLKMDRRVRKRSRAF